MAEKKLKNGRTYKVDPMPATEAFVLYNDLMRVGSKAGDKIGAIITALRSQESDAGVIAGLNTISAMGDVLRSTDSAVILDLLERLLRGVSVKRPSGYAPIDIDEEFTGNLASMVPVALYAAEVHFADFFTESVGSGVRTALAAALRNTK